MVSGDGELAHNEHAQYLGADRKWSSVSTDLELRRLQAQLLLDLTRASGTRPSGASSELLVEEGLLDITPAQANVLLMLVNARSR
jgi:hypothetical protein